MVNGVHVDSRDVKKHRNDIIRIASEMALEKVNLPDEVKKDMRQFIDSLNISSAELKNMRLGDVTAEEIRNQLIDTYL